jgi:hypothetical protein
MRRPAGRIFAKVRRMAIHRRLLRTIMLDMPEKTRELLMALTAALPFEVELTPQTVASLRSQQTGAAVEPLQIVSKISYAGDEGGVMCHMMRKETKNQLVVSLTHVQVHRSLPFAAAAISYQKHRIKKLKKHGSR